MRIRFALLLIALATPATAQGKNEPCVMSPAERAWVESSLEAWRHMSVNRLELSPAPLPTIVVFDEKCRFERASGQTGWREEAHSGLIRLPNGDQAPAQVTSFAGSSDKTGPFFVMALPSVWEAAKIAMSGDWLGLTGVFLHEFSHTRHVAALKPAFDAANAAREMGDDTTDDSLQKYFQSDPAYVAVIEKERDLLFEAAAEPDQAKARKLAADALALMEARQKRWFTDEDSYWKSYDDLFLTMEGFGQWVAFAWLADPAGGKLTSDSARDKMRGGRKWWSQDEGLALLMVVDRFVPDWPKRAFAAQPMLGIDLLRLAMKAQP